MWRRLIIAALSLAVTFTGALAGVGVGGETCPIENPFLFECADYEFAGALIGLAVGVCCGVATGVALSRMWPR